ncbi:MAG: AmmeMemoRadiSam system protein B [Bacteroidales bacterium]|nr:AmmeMemoRadiSam system protein B [Bacteroidales bacterium]
MIHLKIFVNLLSVILILLAMVSFAKYFAILLFCYSLLSCTAQENKRTLINRKAVVAGQFYPKDKEELENQLNGFFDKTEAHHLGNVLAIIVPHAGYVFSGEIAANAYAQIDANKKYKHIFILAPSHYHAFAGASVYNIGNYETPLGEVKVDTQTAELLIEQSKYIAYIPDAHIHEHAIETQLPFLQYYLKLDISIVPIVIGTENEKIIKEIAGELKPFFNEDNLFIISSDFSHYPAYNDAKKVDSLTVKALLKNNPKTLINQVQQNQRLGIKHLATSMCGLSPALVLLYITQSNRALNFRLIKYRNSGDTPYGDKERVVGYNAITISKKDKVSPLSFNLSRKDKETLLKIARNTIVEYVKNGRKPDIDTAGFSKALKTPSGAFVTINKQHKLRGCIGIFSTDLPLYQVVQNMAVSAAMNDPRFSPVQEKELNKLHIEISVLTPMHKINSIDEIEIGKHGIYIKKGYRHGTLLPQVASDNNWTREQFVNYCAQYKAGISLSELKDAELFVYEAIVFDE